MRGKRSPQAGQAPRLASPRSAVVLGGLVLVLMAAEPPLAVLTRQSINASQGSLPIWFSAAFGLVGFVVAWRKPRNPLGWIILAVALEPARVSVWINERW